MEGLWEHVYNNGQWFWMLPSVAILMGLFEGCLFLWFIHPLEERYQDLRVHFSLEILFLGLCVFIQFQYFQVVVHCLAFLTLWICYILLASTNNWKNALFISSVCCLASEQAKLLIKDGLAAGLLAFLMPDLSEGIYNGILLILYLLSLCIAAFLMRKRILRHDRQGMTTSQTICLTFPLVLYLFVRNLQFFYMGGDDYLWIQLQLIQIASAFFALIIIITTENALSVEQERNELLKMEMLLRQQQQQYLVRKETIDAINHKYHDLKHYLAGIEALSLKEAQDYVQAIRREIEPYERCQETGSEILDILLTDRMQECQEKNIRLIPFIDGRNLDFINSLDLCAIFGNAMDNAIEAVQRLEDYELREINIKAGISNGLAVMRFHNFFDGQLKQKGHKLLTQKNNSRNHGYGLENIRRIAEKYGGTAACEIQGQEFTLNIVIPLPSDNRQ